MKKKFIAVSVLICALALGSTTLTSCVDDNESASVTAIRDAKANQLNALAKLSEEQANAVKIQAEADVAIKNAKAAYQQALAEAEQMKTDIAKATLETDIATAKAEAEAALNSQLAALESSKLELINVIGSLENAQQQKASELITYMDNLMNEIHSLNNELITKKFLKVEAEYELSNKEIAKAKEEKINQTTIAENEALIAEYEKYSQEDLTKAKEAALAAEVEAKGLGTQLNDLNQKYLSAQNAANAAYNKLSETPFMANVMSTYRNTDATPDDVEYTIDFGDGTIAKATKVYDEKWQIDTDAVQGLNDQIAYQEKEVAKAELKVKEAEKALADKKATQAYKDAVAAVDAAQKAYDEATTSADKENAWNTLQNAKNALEAITVVEEDNVEQATNDKEYAEEWLADLQETQTYVNDTKAYDEYVKLYDEYVKLRDAEEEAQIAYLKVEHNWNIKNTLATNLSIVANNMTDYAELINDCNEKINNAKQNDVALEAIETQEELIAYYDSQIKFITSKIEVKNKLYAQYEAALTQVFDGQTPEVPETPEEGGEETPAE